MYNHVGDEDNPEEEDDGDDSNQEQVAVVDVFNEEFEEVDHPNLVDYDLIDDVDEHIREDAIDLNEPFMNMYSEPDLDTNVELDEEEAHE